MIYQKETICLAPCDMLLKVIIATKCNQMFIAGNIQGFNRNVLMKLSVGIFELQKCNVIVG